MHPKTNPDVGTLPINLAKERQRLLKGLLDLHKSYKSLITNETESHPHFVVYFCNDSNFFFRVHTPHIEGESGNYFYFEYTPDNNDNFKFSLRNDVVDNIFSHFETWISMVVDHPKNAFGQAGHLIGEQPKKDPSKDHENKISLKNDQSEDRQEVIKIFISYSTLDQKKMQLLIKLLKLDKRTKPIVIPENKEPMVSLSDKVKAGITDCDVFIPILTRQSITTQWVNQEIGFATALNKKIIPIVETEVISQLKGFIHNQVDLSYNFAANTNSYRSENKSFSTTSKLLLTSLFALDTSQSLIKKIEDLFPGTWRSEYVFQDGRSGSNREIIIKDDKFFIDGRHKFDLQNVFINLKSKNIKFLKCGLLNEPRNCANDLTIIELHQIYEGFEDGTTKIRYYRIV